MAAVVALILILILFGVGFTAKVLWFVAAVLLVLWVVGFLARSTDRRWYRW